MAVKDFTNDVRKAQVEKRQALRKKDRAENAEVIMQFTKDPDQKISIEVLDDEVHPVHLMIAILGQHFGLLEQTLDDMLQEINRLQSRVQELEGTNIIVPSVVPPQELVQ